VLLALGTTVLIDHLRGRPDSDHTAAEGLLAGLVVLPITAEAAWRAGEWRRQFAVRGVTLWQADCLIGATALTHGADLATGNPKDFPMEELVVQHWPVGE
jgi:predicted nucleic acid-binding protein